MAAPAAAISEALDSSWSLPRWGASGLTSELIPHPAANLGFREGKAVWIGKPSGERWQLLVDDAALPTCVDDPSRWTWTPGFFAGEVTAVLLDARGDAIAHYLLDVAPSPEKSGRRAFDEMLDELRDLEPALLVGTEPPTLASGTLGAHTDPMIEFARLRRFAPDLLRVLDQIRSQPIRALRVDRADLPVNRIRRVDRATALTALRNPAALAFIDRRDEGSAVSVRPPRLNVPLIEETHDSAANRCVVALGRGIIRRAQSIATQFEAKVQKIDDQATRTDMSERWKVRKTILADLDRRMVDQLRRSPFRDVTRPEITAAGLNAIASHPVYARAWRFGWKAMRTGVEGETLDDRLWTSTTWEVYERWCFARLASDLAATRPDLEWTPVEFGGKGAEARAIGKGPNETIEILFQPSFPGRTPSAAHGFRSIAKGRYPDIVITHQVGEDRRFVVLDAKYRVSRPNVVDAMDSAHLYHDALRWGDERPWVSLLLVPRGGGANWLEEPDFRREHGVGVVELSVGSDRSRLLTELGFDAAQNNSPLS